MPSLKRHHPAESATMPASEAARGLPTTGTAPGAFRGRGMDDRFGQTERTDNWWLIPVAQAIGLTILIGYANYAAFLGAAHYHYVENGRDYLSPFYSPYVKPSWLPSWISPALLILVFPLGFRATCYYYRKAYYRAFFADPTACAVGEPWKGYLGERSFPFILQNLHRMFLFLAVPVLFFLWWDTAKAFIFDGGFGVGGGSAAILANTILLTLYTFSCHSLRHLIGGRIDCFSCAAAGGPQRNAWSVVSWLNGHHMAYAWWSLCAVCFADFYVRMLSMGVWHDSVITFHQLFSSPLPVGQ
jgi:hypothetical protein